MRSNKFVAILALAITFSGYLFVCSASSQSGSRVIQQGSSSVQQGSGTTQGSTSRPSQDFETRFWDYITNGNHSYDYWGPFAGKTEMYEGQSPHGAYLRVYANKTARDAAGVLPANSIIIKENYADDGTTLAAITVMYKVDGYDAENGDWYYIKYLPNGSVDRTPLDMGNQKISGRVDACIDCHSGAGGGDYVFLND